MILKLNDAEKKSAMTRHDIRMIDKNTRRKTDKQKTDKQKTVKQKEAGVALITALLIVSLASIMAVSLVQSQYMDVRRTGNIMTSDKAYLQALTMETSAAHLLKFSREVLEKRIDDKKEFDQAVLGLNASAMQVSEGEAAVSLELVYPGALFNVNTLVDSNGAALPKNKKIFKNLLELVLEDIDEPVSLADNLTDSLLDWIDKDENESPNGAEDSIYESKEPPYKTANQPMASVSELKLVEGYGKKILYGIPKDPNDENSVAIPGILHYVSALPVDSTINLNLVTEPKIIKSLSVYITDTMVNDIFNSQPFADNDAFIGHITWDNITGTGTAGAAATGDRQNFNQDMADAKSLLEVQSSYFVAKSTATLGKSVFILNSLVYVNTTGTKLEVISRAIGTDGI